MSAAAELLRPELRGLRPYRSATFEAGLVRLNANENPWPPAGNPGDVELNWYPEPRPVALQQRLAAHYGVDPSRLLVTRGSSEGIDLLLRGFCRAGTGGAVICPPTFGMYEVYARVQDARIRLVPLLRDRGYAIDVDSILGGWTADDRLVFVCSPNNPTGNSIGRSEIETLCDALRGRGCVVLDAAYAEFAAADPSLELLARFDNVVVLRTLSKAMALAGVRCGVLLAPADLADLLGRILPPYTFPDICARAVERCLEPAHTGEWQRRVRLLIEERQRMAEALARSPRVTRVWPSDANFVMVDSPDPAALAAAARRGGILVRDFSWDPQLPGSIRITIGTPAQNDQLLRALQQ